MNDVFGEIVDEWFIIKIYEAIGKKIKLMIYLGKRAWIIDPAFHKLRRTATDVWEWARSLLPDHILFYIAFLSPTLPHLRSHFIYPLPLSRWTLFSPARHVRALLPLIKYRRFIFYYFQTFVAQNICLLHSPGFSLDFNN